MSTTPVQARAFDFIEKAADGGLGDLGVLTATIRRAALARVGAQVPETGAASGALAAIVGASPAIGRVRELTLRFGRDLAAHGTIPPWLGGWGGAILGLSVGLVLSVRVFRH